jgi:predicted NAD/FAD-binding protein
MPYDPVQTAIMAHAVHTDLLLAAKRAINKHLHPKHMPEATIANHTMLLAWAMTTDQILSVTGYSVQDFIDVLIDAHDFKANYKGPN